MVAGATGIDLFLLVIDAAEGARPQTHEHLAILRLLGIERGVVAVTKADAVDAETLELALEEAHELVPGAEAVAVSAKTGAGLDELRAALARAAAGVERPHGTGATRLYIDRAFTLARNRDRRHRDALVGLDRRRATRSASSRPGFDGAGRGASRCTTATVRARRGGPARRGQPARDRARRGCGAATRSSQPGDYPVDVPARRRARGAGAGSAPRSPSTSAPADVPARVVARRALRTAAAARRRWSPPAATASCCATQTTVGGGTVLDPAPPRGLEPGRLELLERGDPEEIVRALVREPVTGTSLQARGILSPGELARGLASLQQAGDWFFAPEWLDELRASARERLARRAEESPLDPGLPLGELLPPEPWAQPVASLLHVERRGGKAYLPGAAPSLGGRTAEAAELQARLAGNDVVKLDDRELAAYLETEGRLKRVGDGFAVSNRAVRARSRGPAPGLADHARRHPRRARSLPPDGPAPARAFRRGRPHPPRRRRAGAALGGTQVSARARRSGPSRPRFAVLQFCPIELPSADPRRRSSSGSP